MFAAVASSTILTCKYPKKWSRDQKSLHIGFPLQNKMMPQPFSLFLMILMQTDLKINKQVLTYY